VRVLQRVVTAAALGGLLTGGVLFVRSKATRPTVGQRFHTYALFRDGSRLPLGSQVVIAGVRVGEIESLTIEGRLARIGMRLRDDVVLYDDAFAMKKSSSLLGDNYVELAPGGESDQPGPRRRLVSGEPIARVVEGASTDRMLRAVDTALPRVDRGLARARTVVGDARTWTTGSFDTAVAGTEAWLDRGTVASSLATAAEGAAGFEAATERVAGLTAGLAADVDRSLAGFERDVATARTGIADIRTSLTGGLGEARARLDEVDGWLDDAPTLLAAYTGRDPEATARKGQLARLITDGELGADLDEVTEAGAEFTRSLDKVRAYLGYRFEYNLHGGTRYYVTADVATQGDSFVRIELSKGPDGMVPEVTLTDRPGQSGYDQRLVLKEGMRVTAQWAKRFGPGVARVGLKDGSFGFGGDLLLGDRLDLRADIYGASFGRAPRLKVAAALEVFHAVYLLAGADDVLNAPDQLPVAPWPTDAPPRFFRQVHTGRDYFGGFMLKFDDADLTRLVRIYGALVVGLL
jgi:ABC-type transporter Mla subunit MlaD